ncbi:helix-turn-helix domain-containing protein [Streptomyces sp. NPDC046870]|uniref:nSTAND1 domain-containing NTPase n=1 Tax=Streptomyces sp. NPDC046870 TaxID=3155135 RepID=UPI003456CF9F
MGDALGEPHEGADTGNRNSNDGERTVPTTPSFPAQLRRLRQQRGLSLADLARQTHYSKGYLSKIETGAKRATVDVARRCDQILGADGALLRLVAPPRPAEPGAATEAARRAADGTGPACPYPGLSAFTAQDAGRFFGRERATAALVERVFGRVGQGPLLLVAPSGAGKSSLLNAGLVPALRRPGGFPMAGADRWPVVTFTPTARPLDELLERTAKVLGGDLDLTAGRLGERPEALLAAVRSRAGTAPGGRRPPPPPRLVLLVDQVEELFTLCADETERRTFARVLCALAAPAPSPGHDPALVVLGLRADFSGRCLDLPELAPVFTDGLHVLPPMTTAELTESITRPAELAGVRLEPGLVPLLLRDAGLTGAPGAQAVPSGVLPLVSHALLATWRHREADTLTVAGYEATGGIRGAVARTAEDAFAQLYPAEQRTIRRVLSRLVQVSDGTGATRRRVGRSALVTQLADAEGADTALDVFVRARLITVDSDTVEITHEALLHSWPRLREWISADREGLLVRQQLALAAAAWEREGRDPSALYRGARLDTVRSWTEETDRLGPPDPVEEAFLRASGAAEEDRRRQARRQTRLRQALVATLVVLLGCALAAGGIAHRQRADALAQERLARSQALAVRSTLLAGGRPEASMLLAAEAYRTEPTATTRGALLSTQAEPFAARLGGHRGPVNTVAFAPGGRLLATGSSDGTVRLRRLADRRTTATLTVPGRVRALAFSPDGRTLAVTATGGPVRLWSPARPARTTPLPGTGAARAVAFTPHGHTLAVAAADGAVQLWDTARSPRRTARLTGHSGQVDALAFAPDGRTLASAGADGAVRLWDPGRARQVAVLRGHTGGVLGLAFAPDGHGLASGGVDRTVRLWDIGRRSATATLTGHGDDVNAVAYTPDGTTVISASGDGTTRLWDVRAGRLVSTLTGHTDYVMSVAVDTTGTLLATGGFDQSVVLWDLRRRILAARPFTEVSAVAYRPDGRLLATADADRTVRLWDPALRRSTPTTLTAHQGSVTTVAFAPDGTALASAGSDGTVTLWDLAARRPRTLPDGHRGAVFAVAFAPDGHTLASAGADRTVRLQDVSGHHRPAVLTGHTDYVNDVAFSPDGHTLASAGDDLTVRLWDARTHRPLTTLTGHTGAVRGVAFSPDGRTLASCGNDGTVRLWDVARHRLLGSLTGHTGSVRGLAFSPDGRLLASGGTDRTVRLWDVPGRRPWATLTGHTEAVWGVAFAPGGRTVASSGTDGTVRLWDLDTGARLDRICRMDRATDPAARRALLPGEPAPAAPACPEH